VSPLRTPIRQQRTEMPGFCLAGSTPPGSYSWTSCRVVNRSPRIRTCLRAEALQRAGVNFPCTTAAFTLPPEPAGFGVLCQLAQGLSLVCGFCPSARTFVLRLPSDGRLPSRPCLRLVLLIVFMNMNTLGSRTGDFHPISSRPCRAYTTHSSGWLTATADLSR